MGSVSFVRRFRVAGAVVFVFVFLPLMTTTRHASGLREDDLQCEEAVSHLDECCPNFDLSKISCSYVSGCGSTRYAELSIEESLCIQNKDCKEIIAQGICTRVLTLRDADASATTVCQ